MRNRTLDLNPRQTPLDLLENVQMILNVLQAAVLRENAQHFSNFRFDRTHARSACTVGTNDLSAELTCNPSQQPRRDGWRIRWTPSDKNA